MQIPKHYRFVEFSQIVADVYRLESPDATKETGRRRNGMQSAPPTFHSVLQFEEGHR